MKGLVISILELRIKKVTPYSLRSQYGIPLLISSELEIKNITPLLQGVDVSHLSRPHSSSGLKKLLPFSKVSM